MKFEIRSTKSETNPNTANDKSKTISVSWDFVFEFAVCGFVLVSDFVLRVSDFLRFSLPPSPFTLPPCGLR